MKAAQEKTGTLPYEEVRSWQISFNRLINHPIGSRLFKLFLDHEKSPENLLFWRSCKHFEAIRAGAQQKIAAREIMVNYLEEDSPYEIGIDGKLRNELISKINKGLLNSTMFDKAKSQAYAMMERDNFSRFLKSKFYRYVLEQRIPREEVVSWSTNFNRLLKNPEGNVLFRKFLHLERANENLEFWEAVQIYKNLQVDKTQLFVEAKAIFDKFIDESSATEICIDSAAKNDIIQKIDSGAVSRVLFRKAEQQILQSIETDSFSRFDRSAVYREFKDRHAKLLELDFTTSDPESLKKAFQTQI